MADNLDKLNQDLSKQQEDLKEKTAFLSEKIKDIGKESYLSEKDLKVYLQELNKLTETYKLERKQRELQNKLLQEATKTERENISALQKQIQETKKQGFWERIGFTDKRGGLESRYASDQVSRGLNNLFEGRIISGLTELAKSSTKVANFMGGPHYAAMVALSKATIGAIDSFTKFSVISNRLAGGLDTTGKRFTANAKMYSQAIMYNQDPEEQKKFLMSNIGSVKRQQLYGEGQFYNIYNSMRAGLEQLGADPNKANSLISQQLSLGMSNSDIRRFNYELREVTKTMNNLSSDKFLSAFEELNKTLLANNVNGLASAKSLAKFQDKLDKGTLTVSDFTRSLTSRRSAETSTLAGVGAMLAERGLGTAELREAYARGDMIAVAGAMRRGGNKISRDVEKIAPELAQRFGTTDIKEAIAMQAGAAWGQLGPDLKKLDVQDILSKGGSLVVSLEGKSTPITEDELKKIQESEDDLIKESIQLKGAFQALKEAVVGATYYLGASYEHPKEALNTINDFMNNHPTMTHIVGSVPIMGSIVPIIKIASASQLNNGD